MNLMNGPTETTDLVFFVNGIKVKDSNINPEWTLLYYLRNKLNLRGTKQGCGEGGCGACTVMISKIDRHTNRVSHKAVYACLLPICSVHGLAVTTIEGIGSTKTRLHPVQERIAKCHGSQCGFCTPGIVMSMYALLRNNNVPTMEEIMESMQGNLCRCTGYRPIIEAFRSFTQEDPRRDTTENCFPEASQQTPCRLGTKCCRNNAPEPSALYDKSEFQPYDPSQEPIFPPELQLSAKYDQELLRIRQGSSGMTWYRPLTLEQLLRIKGDFPQAKIVNGSSEVTLEMKYKMTDAVLICPSQVEQLFEIGFDDEGVQIGASASLETIATRLKIYNQHHPPHQTRIFQELIKTLHYFASPQIRNIACAGGNLATSSPISDLNPLFLASRSKVVVQNTSDQRTIPIDEHFFTGYRKNKVGSDVIIRIQVPFTSSKEYFCTFKVSKRFEDDIAIVNAAMLVEIDVGVIKDLRFVCGGMDAVTKLALRTRTVLFGLPWNEDIIPLANCSLMEDFPLSDDAPGGMVPYRRTLLLSLFYKSYLRVCDLIRGAKDEPRDEPRSSQMFKLSDRDEPSPIGKPFIHHSAFQQATGEAVYIDDIPQYESELHLAPILSVKPHAKILNVDPTPALEIEGVVKFFSAKDLTKEQNVYGKLTTDETIFADGYVQYHGQVIGTIVARDVLVAKKAAKLVVVEYEDLEFVVDLEEAIKKGSFFHDLTLSLTAGDAQKEFNEPKNLQIEGSCKTGAQEHFYLESQSVLAVPKGENNEMDIFCSIQDPCYTSEQVSKLLNIPTNRIVTKVKRMGGAFGGKETQTSMVALPVAFAAHNLQKPVRCMLDRSDDMLMTGKRHAYLFRYKVACGVDGIIKAVVVDFFLNAGWSRDVTVIAIQKTLICIQNAYRTQNVQVNGYACRTNISSSTAMRGFGAPQGMFCAETIIRHMAHELNMDYMDIIQRNLCRELDRTYYDQQLTNCTLDRCMNECLRSAKFQERRTAVEEFNRTHKQTKKGISVIPIMHAIGFEARFLNQASALVHIYKDGSVLVTHGGTEMGQGLHVKMIQIASHVLGIPHHNIQITETSTDKVPNATSTAASFSSDLYGNAVMNACRTLKERLDSYREKDPGATWEQLVMAAYMDCTCLSSVGFFATPLNLNYNLKQNKGLLVHYYTYGAACSEVMVDCLTGEHKILRTDIVMDIGESLNPAIDIGQIEGAFAQGIGMFTREEIVYLPNGKLFTIGPSTYKLPAFGDIPVEFNVNLLKGYSEPRAIYSSKAVGEPPLHAAASVLFAIYEAIKDYRCENGVKTYFHLDAPATGEKIRLLCMDPIVDLVTGRNVK